VHCFIRIYALAILPLLVPFVACMKAEPAPSDRKPAIETQKRSARADFARGMTVSCPTYGPIWGSPKMVEALDDLSRLGVQWVSLHPYASIAKNGEVKFRSHAESAYLERSVSFLAAREMDVFWKPHLAYWGSFRWRGEITFKEEQQWKRFFRTYSAFILDQAKFAERHKIPIFSIGVETDQTVHRQEWRTILNQIRHVYSGKITYAANWDQVDHIPFWDALDLIGVQAYFPLSTTTHTDPDALWRAWDTPLAKLVSLSHRYDRPVLITEIGYARSMGAAVTPWVADISQEPAAIALRRQLMEIALRRLENTKEIRGLFWWKWIPGPTRGHGDFSMKDSEARAVLKKHWSQTFINKK
jgi:hypothetical protein